MKRFQPGKPKLGCILPKPVRAVRPSGMAGRQQKKYDENGELIRPKLTEHDKLLYAIIERLQEAYPEYLYIHIPNSLYSLISSVPDSRGLWWCFEKSLGRKAARALKDELSDAFKGVPDLTIISPAGRVLQGEVKCGSDRISKPQRRKGGRGLKEWRTVDDFTCDMAAFSAAD